MRVIGTAGHVDHGKTALIRSLTGMDADRLPEEQARGMTTDLGFAWYRGGSGEPIGVVDVPGHERYLRNMVAGAWGLDLAVLVVAADDGWMPQTGLHASIVASLAAPAVVIALTKVDAVPPGRAGLAAREAVERAADLFGFRPEAVPVSNLSGQGIAELKAAIDRALLAMPPARTGHIMSAPGRTALAGTAPVCLFVDRCFSPRGGGVVATGTLVSGSVATGDELLLLPRGEKIKVRGLQSYRERLDRIDASSRAALSFSGLKEGLERGDVLVSPRSAMLVGTEFLCRMLPLPGRQEAPRKDGHGKALVRPGVEAEFALGSARRDALLWPFKDGAFVRVVTDRALACPEGSRFVLLRRGGAELLGRGRVLRAGSTNSQDRKDLALVLPRALRAARVLAHSVLKTDEETALGPCIEALLLGWATLPAEPAAETSRAGAAAGAGAAADAADADAGAGSWAGAAAKARSVGLELAMASNGGHGLLFDQARWAAFTRALATAAAEPGGVSRAASISLFQTAFASGRAGSIRATGAADRERVTCERVTCERVTRELSPDEAHTLAMDKLVTEGFLARNGSTWSLPGSTRALSVAEKAVLARLKAAGKAGLEPGRTSPQTDASALKSLCSFGAAMPLDGGIFVSIEVWNECARAILRGTKTGERFSVPEAKERTGLSRKYILPLLNRMEDKGLVKRSGDERVILKTGV